MKKVEIIVEGSGAQVYAYEIDEEAIKLLEKNAEDGYPISSVEIIEGGEITLISHGLTARQHCKFTAIIDGEEKQLYPIMCEGQDEELGNPDFIKKYVDDNYILSDEERTEIESRGGIPLTMTLKTNDYQEIQDIAGNILDPDTCNYIPVASVMEHPSRYQRIPGYEKNIKVGHGIIFEIIPYARGQLHISFDADDDFELADVMIYADFVDGGSELSDIYYNNVFRDVRAAAGEAFDEDTIRGIVYKEQKLDMYLSFQGGGDGWYVPITKYKEFHHGQDEWNDPHYFDDNINSLLGREQDWEDGENVTLISNKEEALKIIDDWEFMTKISEELKADEEVLSMAIKTHGYSVFEEASDTLKASNEFVTSIIKEAPNALIYASEKIRDDKDLVMTSLKHGGEYIFDDISDELKGDKEVVLTALELGSWGFEGVSDELKADKEVMMAAVQSEPRTLQFASDELKADTDIINAIIPDDIEGIYDEHGINRRHFGGFFEFVSDEFKSNRDLVLSIVKKDGRALEFASEELRKDREVVIEAAANDRNSLEHAEKSLQNDPEVLSQIKKKVLETVENLCSFQCRCLDLQYLGDQKGKYGWVVDDEQVMLAAIRSHGDAGGSGPLDYASDRLKDDREIVIAAVRKKGQWALNSASERLKDDPEIKKIIEELKA